MWADTVPCNVLRPPCCCTDCTVVWSVLTVYFIYWCFVWLFLYLMFCGVDSQGNWWTGIGNHLEGSGKKHNKLLKLVTVLFGCAHLSCMQGVGRNQEVLHCHCAFVLRYTDSLHMERPATAGSSIFCPLWHFSCLYGNYLAEVGIWEQ
jgi:hypothetical protein